MKYIKRIIICLILFLLGCLFTNLVFIHKFGSQLKSYGFLESIYYFSSIFGSIGAFGAVVVALFKDEIVAKSKEPKLSIELTNDNSFIEDKLEGNNEEESTQQHIVVSNYLLKLKVVNSGKSLAKDCEIIIEKTYYGKDKDALKIIDNGDSKELKWKNNKDQINIKPFGDYAYTDFIRISSPANTPKQLETNVNTIGQSLLWFGNNLIKNKSGWYKLCVLVTSSNAQAAKKEVVFWWSGKWQERINEFENEIKIEVE